MYPADSDIEDHHLTKIYTEADAEKIGEKLGIVWEDSNFDCNQFCMGMNVELEHGLCDLSTNITNDDDIMTGKIAWIHLKEVPNYYDLLDKYVEDSNEDTEDE